MKDARLDGVEHAPPTTDELDDNKRLAEARENDSTLLSGMSKGAVAKYVEDRWRSLDDVTRRRLATIKVNHMRYEGVPFVQVHPSDPNRVFMPPGRSTSAPTINKVKRAVHRYTAQITADEPVMEGVPDSHSDEARDQAEAATLAIRGEWSRMKLKPELQRTAQIAAVQRSAFWFFEWDEMAGGMQKAQKFFPAENGEQVLRYVDSSGSPVHDPNRAASIRQGETVMSVLTLANVRWRGGRYAHDATEVMVGIMMPLSDLYDKMPSTREAKVAELLGNSKNAPVDSQEWLQDLRAASPRAATRSVDDSVMSKTAERMEDVASVLDEKVLVQHYFHKRSRMYPKGVHVIKVGNYLVHRGPLRWKVIPVAHFKCMDEIGDPTGLAVVDLLKDPQALLDFVNGQILRYLQMLKRRWFVPMHSGVKARDLQSPTRSVIEYNPQAGAPTPEVQPEIPNSMVNFVGRFDSEFNDQLGIHDTLQGKHVPGVSSGRHAEALRSGDETLLGLSRDQLEIGLEAGSVVMLEAMKREWKVERRVRFLGSGRTYVERAFSASDFGHTSRTKLKNSTLLMLTPAQRMETILALAEAGNLTVEEVRQLAPLGDVMGISLSEDVHYQRARRQNERFLAGPPKKLELARKLYEAGLNASTEKIKTIEAMQALGTETETITVAMQAVELQLATLEAEWQAAVDRFAFDHRSWEDRKDVARIHADEHARALAHERVDRFPEWWVMLMEAHATLEWQLGFPEDVAEKAALVAPTIGEGGELGGGAGVDAAPPGLEFGSESAPVVGGGAP